MQNVQKDACAPNTCVFSPKPKKHKADSSGQPLILPSSGIPNSQALLSSFTMALKCYELLHSKEELRKGE